MKIHQFLFLNLLAIPRSFGENICEDVTFDECNLDEGKPIDIRYTYDEVECQGYCQLSSSCTFFRFDLLAEIDNCIQFEINYRDSCNIVAAPINRDVNQCLSNATETCDKMIDETCKYNGLIESSTPGFITGATDCDELCQIQAGRGCLYWEFNKNLEICTTFNSNNKDRKCSIVSGPEKPDIASCKGTSTTSNVDNRKTTTTPQDKIPTTTAAINSANRLM